MLKLLWLTDRGERHQQGALKAAPSGWEVTVRRSNDLAEVLPLLAEVEMLITERRGTIDTAFLDAAPNLRFILRLGSLAYDIDLEACRARGIVVSVQPVPMTMLVAEHLMMAALALVKRLKAAQDALLKPGNSPRRTDENTFSYNWQGLQGVGGLMNKTVAILGMGEIGVELARRLQPFRLGNVLYNKRLPYPSPLEAELGIAWSEVEEAASRADLLINLLPYSPETDGFISKRIFDLMPEGSFFLHAGSGSTVNEEDLVEALRNGRLAGAALDTFEYEPLPAEHPLAVLAHDPAYNVILTPHVAAGTLPLNRREDYAEAERFLNGEALRYRVV
jgi:phosphoglycerate dehydrogenase-like enzyme